MLILLRGCTGWSRTNYHKQYCFVLSSRFGQTFSMRVHLILIYCLFLFIGDSLSYESGFRFSTFDCDNDNDTGNCAADYRGAWWYNQCFHANLNGQYLAGKHTVEGVGIEWNSWHGDYYSLKSSKMMVAKTK